MLKYIEDNRGQAAGRSSEVEHEAPQPYRDTAKNLFCISQFFAHNLKTSNPKKIYLKIWVIADDLADQIKGGANGKLMSRSIDLDNF